LGGAAVAVSIEGERESEQSDERQAQFGGAAIPWPGSLGTLAAQETGIDVQTRNRSPRPQTNRAVWVSEVGSSKQVTIPLQSVEPADVIRTGERSIEGFDDLHAAAAPRARWFLVGGAQILVIITVAIRRRKRHIKQPATERELVSAMAVGKKAVMTNALEAVRQDVKEETTDEFGDLKSQDRAILSATLPSAFWSESDVRLVEIDQAVVSDCDAVSVPGDAPADVEKGVAALLALSR
jgi:hypothetical protein